LRIYSENQLVPASLFKTYYKKEKDNNIKSLLLAFQVQLVKLIEHIIIQVQDKTQVMPLHLYYRYRIAKEVELDVLETFTTNLENCLMQKDIETKINKIQLKIFRY
jgi:hypothetical protein